MSVTKKVLGVYGAGSEHWVGDGFPVKNLFPSNGITKEINPFLMLDYAGPSHFEPSNHTQGVGEHPHRGFETVTIAYQGSVSLRDSAGNAGTIYPGDVQWMTAASGIVHEEMHAQELAEKGGTLEMVQLWVIPPKPTRCRPSLSGDHEGADPNRDPRHQRTGAHHRRRTRRSERSRKDPHPCQRLRPAPQGRRHSRTLAAHRPQTQQ